MILSNKIHEGLEPSERASAALAAMARDDEDELRRLKDTCPKKKFLMTDPAYTDKVKRLVYLTLAVETDLQAQALEFFIASRLEDCERIQKAVDQAHRIEASWHRLLGEMRVSPDDMSKIGPSRHPAVKAILDQSPEALADDEEASALEAMRDYVMA